jgi:NodT family efflux transporter outer membrane factor (OMF) lipoprotein
VKPGIAIAFTAALLAGCTKIGPLPDVASVSAPQAYIFVPETAANLPLLSLLPTQDAALAPLLEAALKAPNLEAALARVDAARALVRGAAANRLPDISGSGNATTNRASSAGQTGNPVFDRDTNQFQGGVQASWDLDIFGRLRANQRAALARLDAAGADADAVRLALESDIATALIDYRDASNREAVVGRDLTDAVELVRLTRIRARAGIVPGFDVARAESLARDARARLAPFAGARASALGRIVALTALEPQAVQSPLTGAGVAGLPPVLTAGVPSQLLKNRPDIRAAAFRLSAAKQDVAAAAAARFPRIALTGALGLLTLGANSLLSGDALSASVGAGVAGPLIDFGRIGSEIDRQKAVTQEAFATYRRTVFQALGDAEGALGTYTAALARASALADQAKGDADGLSIAQERYRLGLADFLTVIDAQRTLNGTRQNAEAARLDAHRQAVVLYRTLGGRPR